MARNAGGDDRRAAILDATVRVLARDGLNETTTRKIAREANVNQAMIGYYFGGKDELLYAVLEEMIGRTGEIIGASIPHVRTFGEAVTAAVTAFWSHVEQAPELQVMQYELTLYALRRSESAWLAKRQYAGYCDTVARIIHDICAATGVVLAETDDALARFVVGGLDGLILQFISDRDAERARGDLQRLIAATHALAMGVASDDTPTETQE